MNTTIDPTSLVDRLRGDLSAARAPAEAGELLCLLVERRLDRLPLPASGATLQRWQALAVVAQHDLSLAKLYEGHTDALAILHELRGPAAPDGSLWGVWAAEGRDAKLTFEPADDGTVRLRGTKPWCSGAAHLSHALVTAWAPQAQGPQMVWVDLRQRGVVVDGARWQALGMNGSASVDVSFDAVRAHRLGPMGAYLSRPGFWHGGAGIAACWYGGAAALAQALRPSLRPPPGAPGPSGPPHPFKLAAIGRVDLLLSGMAARLREAARWIDEHPAQDAQVVALRVRLAAEDGATRVLEEVSRALGATPFCRDARFARFAVDLPVFIRQSHSDHDAAALGACCVGADGATWTL